ncbi:MAG: hypothetical protein JW825_04460 [Candidatus Methanofastidiosa archaeon]|nr:hypothetical protein [Candidatus Methanofastidiosa archaeon]
MSVDNSKVKEAKEAPKAPEEEIKPIKVAGECEIGTVLDCATCKRCSLVCPTELNLEKVVRISRYLKDPKGSHRNVFKVTSKLAGMAETQSWLKKGETGTDIAYFPGCSALFDILLQRDTNYSGAAEAAVLSLNKLGFKPEIIYGCCGHDLYYSGALDEFEIVKKELSKKLEGKKIVVGCGECYHMLKNVYNADVITFAEFVFEQHPKFEKTDLKTTYHDPCRLGRYNEIYDAPRELLKKASDFREMENIREEAICCSVSAWLNCNKHAREVRFNRIREAKATGADYIVTACNKCSIHLDCVHYELNKEEVKDLEGIKIIGLEEVVGYALGVYDPFKEEKSYEVSEIKGKFLEPITIEKDLERYIDEDLIEQAFRCTSCKNCTIVCPVHYDTPGLMMEVFRPELVKRGYAPEKHTKIASVLKKTGNAFGVETGVKSKVNPKAKYIYFPGCVAQYRRDDVFQATVKILDLLGVDYEIPEGLVCCGSVLKRTGHPMDFLIEQNMKVLKGKPIITSCSGCYATLKKDYEGLDVHHITDIIKENIGKLPLKEVKKKVMYHDPCHLGRKFSYYDVPREIIKAIPGIELVPFDKEKENAQCCGAGGGVKSAKPDLANDLAKKKMEEAKGKDVDMVVSSCPFCELNLADNCEDIPVVDILNLIMESLGVKA